MKPRLPEGWVWGERADRPGDAVAMLFTLEYDCYVELHDGSLSISSGAAPVEVVEAVIKANKREPGR